MFAEALYNLLYEQDPFLPFRIHLSNGKVLEVPHIDYAMLPPHRQYLIVESATKPLLMMVNLDQITHIERVVPSQSPEIGSETGTRK
jgi:hypothetical protein